MKSNIKSEKVSKNKKINNDRVFEELQEKEKDYKAIIETAHEAIVIANREGIFLSANQAAVDILGYESVEELIGKDSINFYSDPIERELLLKKLITKGYVKGNELTFKKKNGELIYTLGSASTIKDEYGNLQKIIGIFQDITIRKQAEEDLKKIKEKYQILVENTNDGVFILDVNGRFTYVNKVIEQRSKFPAEKFIGLSYLEIVHEKEHNRVIKNFKKIMKGEKVLPYQLDYINDDGETLTVEVNTSPFYENGKIVGLHGISRDLTGRIQVEEEIKKEKEKTDKILDLAGSIIVALDKKGNITLINRKGYETLGYDYGELIGENWFETCLPKKKIKEVENVLTKSISGEIEHFKHYENPVLTKNGEQRIIEWYNTLIIDNQGNNIGTISSGNDITERKVMEKKLQEYAKDLEKKFIIRTLEVEMEKEKYKNLFEKSNEPIYIIEPESGNVIDCNLKAKLTCNCNYIDCCKKKFFEVYTIEEKNIVIKSINNVINDGFSNFVSPVKLIAFNKPIYLETNLTLIEYGKEKIIQAICKDITHTIKIEEEMMKKKLKYEIEKGFLYLIEETVLGESIDVFNNLTDCGFKGYIFSRPLPEFITKNVSDNVQMFWMANKKIDKNTIMPTIDDLESSILNLKRGNNVILIERIDYLLSKNTFQNLLEFFQRIVEFIYIQKWVLLISIDPRIVNKNELIQIKKESNLIKSKKEIKLNKKTNTVLKYINNKNKSGKKPSINEIASHFEITRKTARERIYLLENLEFIRISEKGRQKLMEITDKGKENI